MSHAPLPPPPPTGGKFVAPLRGLVIVAPQGYCISGKRVRGNRCFMQDPASQLPEFDNPPIQEAILSVEFERLATWKIAHYGAFWAKVRADYPTTETQPAIPPASSGFAPAGVTFGPADNNLARVCFINAAETMQIQVQYDRFRLAWARHSPSDDYPRYTAIRSEFERQWQKFLDFVQAEKFPPPQPKRCEIIYVNHVDAENNWEKFQFLEKIFAPWSHQGTDRFLPRPKMVSIASQYTWADQGELHIALQPAIRLSDQAKLIQLILTARLPLAGETDTQFVLGRFDLGRERIVRGFADVTTKEMHSLWKRKA